MNKQKVGVLISGIIHSHKKNTVLICAATKMNLENMMLNERKKPVTKDHIFKNTSPYLIAFLTKKTS